jgi:integrase
MAEALDAELVTKNPLRKLEMPDTKASKKPVLSKEDARRLLDALPFQDRLIASIGAFCAMRPGELFGLQRSSFEGNQFRIQGTAWRGKMQPGKAKTDGSLEAVAIPDLLIPMITNFMEATTATSPDDLLFPSTRTRGPMWPSRWLATRLRPVARRLGITTPVTFQVLRRSFATNVQQKGSAKDVQTHLRHSRIATTLEIYTQPVAASVRAMVNAYAEDILAGPVATTSVQ